MKIFVTFGGDITGRLTTPGGAVHVIEVCRNFSTLGHQVTLFVPNYGVYPHDVPFKIVYVPIPHVRYLRTIAFPITLFLVLASSICKDGCDIIYENDISHSLTGIIIARLFRKRHFMTIHGFSPEEMKMGGHSWLRLKIIEFFQRLNYRLSNGLFCVTPLIVERVHSYYKVPRNKMVFIFNGVDAGLCRPMNRDEVFNVLKLSRRKNYVGFIGYLYPWSGLESLIEAAPKVISKLPDVSFIIVGHGHWGEHLQSLTLKHQVKDNFLFTGYQPWDMIPLYCNAFDVGITPYVGEKGIGRYRSSMKTLEYMAAGTPVIITHAEGVSDIVEDAGCGIVIPPDDSNALANAITQIIGNPIKGQEMGESGREVVLANFTWKHTVTRMIKFIDNVN